MPLLAETVLVQRIDIGRKQMYRRLFSAGPECHGNVADIAGIAAGNINDAVVGHWSQKTEGWMAGAMGQADADAALVQAADFFVQCRRVGVAIREVQQEYDIFTGQAIDRCLP